MKNRRTIENDPCIARAVSLAWPRFGSRAAFAHAVGIDPGTVGRYINGYIRRIDLSTWAVLYPHLLPCLPDDPKYRIHLPPGSSRYLEAHDSIDAAYPDKHPCSGRPQWLLDVCRRWDDIPEALKTALQAVAESAVRQAELTRNPLHRVGAA